MKSFRIAATFLAALSLAGVALAQSDELSADQRNALKAQAEHFRIIKERGRQAYYHEAFDLSGLPHYRPRRQLSGWLRIHGNNYLTDGALGDYWQQAFAKYQPGIHISYFLPTSAAALGALDYDQ